jgi:SWI/SNF-related matrix-associated actin-dependent regulator of chromatin subfamily A-like protein 1
MGVMPRPSNIHPSAFEIRLSFGSHRGESLGELAQTEKGQSYLTWLKGCATFFDPYWPRAAAETLSGLPVAPPPAPPGASSASPSSTALSTEKAGPPRATSNSGNNAKVAAVVARVTASKGRSNFVSVRLKPGDAGNSDLLREKISGRWWNAADACWEIPKVQLRRAVELLGGEARVELAPEVVAAYQAERDRRAKLDGLRTLLKGTLKIPKLLHPLLGYQTVAVEFFLACKGRVIVADEVGLGKTVIAIAAALYTGDRTLVIVPAVMRLGWQRKIMYFAGKDSTLWDGSEMIGDLKNQFHLVSYEIFTRRKAELALQGFTLLIVDECHNFSNPKSLRSLALFGGTEKRAVEGTRQKQSIKHARFVVERCMMLTATAINNHPRELFPLVNYLSPERFPSFWDYGHQYGAFQPGNLNGLPSKPKNLDDLHERIGDLVIRRTEADVGTTRPKALPTQDLWIDLTPSERRTYNQLLKDLLGEWAESGRPTLSAMHVLREWLNDVKLPFVWSAMQALLDRGESVVLFSTRVDPLERTVRHFEELGVAAVLITGKVSEKKRYLAIDAFGERRARVAALGLRSGGTGVDGLQHGGHHAFFLDLDYVPPLHHQGKGRLDRTGQLHAVETFNAMVRDSVDETLASLHVEKERYASMIMDGRELKRFRRTSLFKDFVKKLKAQYREIEMLADADEREGALEDGDLDQGAGELGEDLD